MMTDKTQIFHDAIVGFAVIMNTETRVTHTTAMPISFYPESIYSIELEDYEELISVIPAPPESFLVTGLYDDKQYFLGYDMKDASRPNWLAELITIHKEAQND